MRSGDTVEQLLEVMQQVGATEVVCESEVEYRWLKLQEDVQSSAPPPQTQLAFEFAPKLPRALITSHSTDA